MFILFLKCSDREGKILNEQINHHKPSIAGQTCHSARSLLKTNTYFFWSQFFLSVQVCFLLNWVGFSIFRATKQRVQVLLYLEFCGSHWLGSLAFEGISILYPLQQLIGGQAPPRQLHSSRAVPPGSCALALPCRVPGPQAVAKHRWRAGSSPAPKGAPRSTHSFRWPSWLSRDTPFSVHPQQIMNTLSCRGVEKSH